jgi:hypothetical protein
MQPAHFLFKRMAATRALYLSLEDRGEVHMLPGAPKFWDGLARRYVLFRGLSLGPRLVRCPLRVVAGHSRTKDGVASLAYDPAIHDDVQRATSVRS